MLWEVLVTDGHVRAARLRRLQPWIIALGIVLLWLGFFIVQLGPDLQPGMPAAARLQERLMKLQERSDAAFRRIPPLSLPTEAQNSLPPAREIEELVPVVIKSLTESGDLPEADLKFKEVDDVETFWKGEWGTEQLDYLRHGDDVLIGGNVSFGSPTYPQPGRWVGLFHKGEDAKGKDVWAFASISAGNLSAPRGLPVMGPQQVALSLAPFLPEPPPEPKRSEQQAQ